MNEKDPCFVISLFNGEQEMKSLFDGEASHFLPSKKFFLLYCKLYVTKKKKHTSQHLFIKSKGCTGFKMICASMTLTTESTVETLMKIIYSFVS